MRRTIEARRGDVMHYTGGLCKSREAFESRVSWPLTGANLCSGLTRLPSPQGASAGNLRDRGWLANRSAEGAKVGAGERNRTVVISLEGCCSTIELHPQLPRTCYSSLPGRASRTENNTRITGTSRVLTNDPFGLVYPRCATPGFYIALNGRCQLTTARPFSASSICGCPGSSPCCVRTSSGVFAGTSGKTGRPPGNRTPGARDK